MTKIRSHAGGFPMSCAVAAIIAITASALASDKDSDELATALKNEEQSYQQLQRARTQLANPYESIKDWRGNNLSDDLLQNVLTPEAAARLEPQLQGAKEALRRHDLDTARSLINEIGAELAAQANTYRGIRDYWSRWGSHAPDRSAYYDNLAKNGIARSYAEQIGAAERHYSEQVSSRHFLDAMNEGYPALNSLYERAAEEESAAIAAAIERGQFTPLLSRRGAENCSGPVPPTSGSETPKFYKVESQTDFYPTVSKRAGETGTARLYVRVSEAGCVTEAIVTASTGYPRLDIAALDLVTRSRFEPAERDGHAVAGGLPFKFSFKLRD